jgi:hypothetical protein
MHLLSLYTKASFSKYSSSWYSVCQLDYKPDLHMMRKDVSKL